jgi:aminoglycoside phosphotransferase (APT) family kinase protein
VPVPGTAEGLTPGHVRHGRAPGGGYGPAAVARARMHADQVETDAGVVRRLLLTQFPAWAGLPVEPVDSFGTDNDLYRLGSDLCARLPLNASSVHVDFEHEWLPRLAPALPLAIPVPLAVGEPGEGYPFRWCVQPWLPGENPVPERFVDPDEAARDLARFVRALRGLDTTGAPPSRRGVPLAAEDGSVRASLAAAADLVDVEAATAAWNEALAAPAHRGPAVWSHGDLLVGNLLATGGRLSAVIDWAVAGVGDPAIDLLPAWGLFGGEAREVFRRELGVGETEWARGRGWALACGLGILPYYRHTNAGLFAVGLRLVEAVLAPASRP